MQILGFRRLLNLKLKVKIIAFTNSIIITMRFVTEFFSLAGSGNLCCFSSHNTWESCWNKSSNILLFFPLGLYHVNRTILFFHFSKDYISSAVYHGYEELCHGLNDFVDSFRHCKWTLCAIWSVDIMGHRKVKRGVFHLLICQFF